MNPIGVEFHELDAEGLFHYQRLHLMADFRCVKAANNPHDLQSPDAATGSLHSRDQANGPANSMVWIGSSATPAQVQAALELGNHVLCGLPTVGAVDEWRRLFRQQLDVNSPRIFVAALHRWDGCFRTVQSQINEQGLGTVESLCRISRQYVPGELSQRPDETDSGDHHTSIAACESRTFELKWFEFLDELLLLSPQSVRSVWARPTGSGRSAWVTLADGCQAHLELHHRSLAPLETGWIIEGTRAGFASGRRYRAEGDYELVDVPVEGLPTQQETFYQSLIATIRDGEPFPVTYESILRVLELRDAIETSLRSGRTLAFPG